MRRTGAGLALALLPLVGGTSTRWLLQTSSHILTEWIVSELDFYSDTTCTEEISTSEQVSSVLYSCCDSGCDGGEPTAIMDGICTVGCVHDKDENWASCAPAHGSQSQRQYIGYEFASEQEVQCVKMCQCSSILSCVNNACVFRWSEEAGWVEVGSLSFKGRHGEYQAMLSAEKFNCSLHDSLVASPPPSPAQDGDANSSKSFAGRTLAIILVCSAVGAACLTVLTLYIKKRRFFTPQDLNMFTASAVPSRTSEGTELQSTKL